MNYVIDELEIGQKASFTKTISENDVYLFAGISGDMNPAHLDEEYARSTFFKKRIAHGLIAASLISNVLGMKLPGVGTIWVKQDLEFLAPVYFGDTITATVEIVEVLKDKKKVKVSAYCVNQNGAVVLKGMGIVSPPKVKVE